MQAAVQILNNKALFNFQSRTYLSVDDKIKQYALGDKDASLNLEDLEEEEEEDEDEDGGADDNELEILYCTPGGLDSLEDLFLGSEDNLNVEGIIDVSPRVVLRNVIHTEMDSVFNTMNNFKVDDAERKYKAQIESIQKQRLIHDMRKRKNYTREQMVELVKSGQVAKLLEQYKTLEYRSVDLFFEKNEITSRHFLRIELYIILQEYVRFMFIYGLWSPHLLGHALKRLDDITTEFANDLPIIDKVRTKILKLHIEIASGKANYNNSDLEDKMFALFEETDTCERFINDVWKQNPNLSVPKDIHDEYFRMRWELPYLLFEQYVYRGKLDEGIALMDKLIAYKGKTLEQQPERIVYLSLKSLALAYQGKYAEAKQVSDEAEAAGDHYHDALEQEEFDIFSLGHAINTLVHLACNKETFLDINLAATCAHEAFCWLDDEEHQQLFVDPLERPYSMSIYSSLVAEALKKYDGFEMAKWANLGIRITQNYNMLGNEFPHFLVMKAEALQAVPDMPRDIIEPYYIQAREVIETLDLEGTPYLVEINESYARFLESLGGEELEIEKLRKEANDIQERFGYKYIKRHNLLSTLLYTMPRKRVDQEELKNYKTADLVIEREEEEEPEEEFLKM